MILENLKPACGSTKAPKRKGRGQGSGNGKNAATAAGMTYQTKPHRMVGPHDRYSVESVLSMFF